MTQGSQEGKLARFQRDVDYFESHRGELLQRFPDQWVAIFDQESCGGKSRA